MSGFNTSGTVYFVQPKDGGPIRVGTTQALPERTVTIGSWHPQGVEIVATLPGYFAREAIIHQLLRPVRLERDWFRSGPMVWSLLLDVLHDRLSWLPAEPTREEWRVISESLRARLDRAFLDDTDLAQTASMTVASIGPAIGQNWRPSVRIYAALVVRELWLSGEMPSYLAARLVVPA